MKSIQLYLIFGISLLFALRLVAQNEDKEKYVKLGHKSDSLMYVFINQSDIEKGLEYCIEKEKYFFKGESWEDYVKALNDKAFLYHATSNLELLKKSVFRNFEEANKYLKPDHKEWLRAKEQINSYHYFIGDYKSALDIINEVIPMKEQQNRSKWEISTSYFNLGTAYNHLRDTEKALGSFKKSINVLYEDGRLGLSSGEFLLNIARVYQSMGELDSALYYLNITESLFDTINMEGRFKKRKVEAFFLTAETCLEKEDFEKVEHYLDVIRKIKLTDRENIYLHEMMAKFYHEKGEYKKSMKAMLKANALAEEKKSRYSPPYRARRIIDYAKTLILNGEEDEALAQLQNGLKILSPNSNFTDDDFNPNSKDLLDKRDALILLQEKGRIHRGKYNSTGDKRYLESAYNAYSVACDVIRDVRQGIRSADSKNDLSENAVSVYEEAISTAYKMYESTGNEEFIVTAFKLAESNKAQLLLENLNEQEALGFAGIPDSLSRKDKDLRFYLATLEDRVARNGKSDEDDELIFNTKHELDQFTTFLEKSYPRYYRQKYSNDAIEPSFIQKELLDDKTVMIEYFVGLEDIYVFIISSSKMDIEIINKESLALDEINNLRNTLKQRPGMDSPEMEFQKFAHSARAVYRSFVQKALDNISSSIETLIIIPDDLINFIPFEVLLLNDPKNEKGYSMDALSYLFEKYTINYNYSATLLSKVKSKELSQFKDNFIGYAPTFSENLIADSRSTNLFELSSLKCNRDEVNAIKGIIGGQKRISEAATKADFLNEANDHKIIHLATHAFVNQSDSKLNKIFLQDDFLSEVNIYNLELNTELAVLSACNTGSGELIKGEGVMNLARGFMNAGCSSTLMSMWSVDDCATSDLMVLFYKELKSGLNKDEALRQAKINYLNTANKTKLHPYYWAAFVPFGDMKAMEFNMPWYSNTILWIFIGIAMLVLTYLYFRKK